MTQPVNDVTRLVELVRAGAMDQFVREAEDLEPADLADVLQELDDDERITAVRSLPSSISGPALAELPEGEHAEETLLALDPELASASEAAVALEAKAIVLGTGSDVRPTQTNIKRLRSIFARLPKPAVTLCWEPQGIWERAEILGHAREFEAIPVFDAARDALAPGPVAYTRIRALGASVVGPQLVDRLAAALRARRESFVVVEHAPSARRLRKELSERLGKGAAAGPQVRAVPGRLRAEDEEQ